MRVHLESLSRTLRGADGDSDESCSPECIAAPLEPLSRLIGARRLINIFVHPTGRIYYSRGLRLESMESRVSMPEHETPTEIGQILANWVVRKGSDRILDPAMGTGALLRC